MNYFLLRQRILQEIKNKNWSSYLTITILALEWSGSVSKGKARIASGFAWELGECGIFWPSLVGDLRSSFLLRKGVVNSFSLMKRLRYLRRGGVIQWDAHSWLFHRFWPVGLGVPLFGVDSTCWKVDRPVRVGLDPIPDPNAIPRLRMGYLIEGDFL